MLDNLRVIVTFSKFNLNSSRLCGGRRQWLYFNSESVTLFFFDLTKPASMSPAPCSPCYLGGTYSRPCFLDKYIRSGVVQDWILHISWSICLNLNQIVLLIINWYLFSKHFRYQHSFEETPMNVGLCRLIASWISKLKRWRLRGGQLKLNWRHKLSS